MQVTAVIGSLMPGRHRLQRDVGELAQAEVHVLVEIALAGDRRPRRGARAGSRSRRLGRPDLGDRRLDADEVAGADEDRHALDAPASSLDQVRRSRRAARSPAAPAAPARRLPRATRPAARSPVVLDRLAVAVRVEHVGPRERVVGDAGGDVRDLDHPRDVVEEHDQQHDGRDAEQRRDRDAQPGHEARVAERADGAQDEDRVDERADVGPDRDLRHAIAEERAQDPRAELAGGELQHDHRDREREPRDGDQRSGDHRQHGPGGRAVALEDDLHARRGRAARRSRRARSRARRTARR